MLLAFGLTVGISTATETAASENTVAYSVTRVEVK